MRMRTATCLAALLVSAASSSWGGSPAPRRSGSSHGSTAAPAKATRKPSTEQSDGVSKQEVVQKPALPRPIAWINADACPEPLSALGNSPMEPYETFMNQALKLPPSAEELVVIRISPSFGPDETLSLFQGRDRRYVLRSRELTDSVWGKMWNEMRAQQGLTIRADAEFQRAALARVAVETLIHERTVDASTAKLLLDLWGALVARAQVVQEVGAHTAKFDGVRYTAWHKGIGVTTHSPEPGSVLAQAVSAAKHLLHFVDVEPGGREVEKGIARKEMQSALQRTRRKEACLREYQRESE